MYDKHCNNIVIYNAIRKLGLKPNNYSTTFILRAIQLAKAQKDIVILNDIYIKLSKTSAQFFPNQIKKKKYLTKILQNVKSVEKYKIYI